VAFNTILGQEHALALLQKALVSTRLGHAYLFYGPSGVGKKLTAMQFAKALACQDAVADACDRCTSCHTITTGNHPDVIVINPEGMSIRIEHMRAVQRQLGYKPYTSPRTVVIIDGCERFTSPAANALLKTLEEPPATVLLLLLTSQKDASLSVRSPRPIFEPFWCNRE
jgi:DNA polymerase-3 subunit delta'